MLMAQNYCLIYRFTAIQLNKRVYRTFVSTRSKIFCIGFQQSISIFMGIFAYFACVQPEVGCFRCSYRFLKEFPDRIRQEESLEVQRLMDPENPFFLWLDIEKAPRSLWFFGTIILGFFTHEMTSAVLIYLIIKILKRNSSQFSETTHRLHRQAIIVVLLLLNPRCF